MKKDIVFLILFIFICSGFIIFKLKNNYFFLINDNLKMVSSINTKYGQEDKESEEEMIFRLIKEYEKNTENFNKVSVDIIYEKINNRNSFFIYVGRVTCEWCRLFVPILSEYAMNNNIEIFYIDSTNTETDTGLKKFRETNNIENIPALLYYSDKTNMQKIEFDITDENFNINDLEKAILNKIK